MTTKVNYIVASYIGPNRTYPHYQALFDNNPLYFFKKHINFLNTLPHNIRNKITATFVFNDDVSDEIKQTLRYYLPLCYKLVFRKNSGFSYGIWNDVITKTLNDYDYFFLIEDDYIPSRVDFIDHFIKMTDNDVAFVCSLVEDASHERFPEHVPVEDGTFPFPSISNGLITAESCRAVYKKHNTIFNINQNNDYWSAYKNQIYFCKYFTDMGFNLADTTNEFQSPYNNANDPNYVIYGDSRLPPILEPIEVPRD